MNLYIPSFKATCVGQPVADVTIALAAVDPCYSCTERLAVAVDATTKKVRFTFEDLLRLSQAKTERLRKGKEA